MGGFAPVARQQYRGRHLTIGMTADSKNIFVAYSFEGRSPPSRARVFSPMSEHNVIRTMPTDESVYTKGSPGLLLYPAVAFAKTGNTPTLLASNGAQTRLLYDTAVNGESIDIPREIIETAFFSPAHEYDPKFGWVDITSFEPDTPHFTPRISGVAQHDQFALHIVYKSDDRQGGVGKDIFPDTYRPGIGSFISTYDGVDQNPLQPFSGGPVEVQLESRDPQEAAEEIFEQLAPAGGGKDVRGGIAVVFMSLEDAVLSHGIVNKQEESSVPLAEGLREQLEKDADMKKKKASR